MVGALSAMAPTRRSDIANVAIRGFIAGCAVCFMTACIAGNGQECLESVDDEKNLQLCDLNVHRCQSVAFTGLVSDTYWMRGFDSLVRFSVNLFQMLDC